MTQAAPLFELLGMLLMIGGAAFIVIGGIGVLRLPDFYTRIHAAGVTEVLGMLLVLAGIIVHLGLSLSALKIGAILAFLLLTGPTSAYAMANAAWLTGVKPQLHGSPPNASE
jgi:multicomponent Na+:H+ antiporter subunit G